MKTKQQKREDLILNVVLWLVLILACLGVVSSVMWYLAARQVNKLEARLAAQTVSMQIMADDVKDKRYKIGQANRLLSAAYPGAKMDFISE
jgi:hypothetical protein